MILNNNIYIGMYIFLTTASILACFTGRSLKFHCLKRAGADYVIVICLSLLLAALASMRPEDTPDTQSYLNVYSFDLSEYGNKDIHYGERYKGMEFFFVLLMNLLKRIGFSYRAELFLFGFLNSFLIIYASMALGKACSVSEVNVSHTVTVFLSQFAYHYCCIAIRSGFGIGLGLLGIAFLTERSNGKRVVGLMLLAAACLCHSMSILLAFPAIELCRKRKNPIAINKWLVFTGFICVLILTFNLAGLFIGAVTSVFLFIKTHLGIDGLSGYFSQMDINVGLRDWLIVLSVLMFLSISSVVSNGKKQLLIANDGGLSRLFARFPAEIDGKAASCGVFAYIASIGLYVMAFLYPIRAVGRAADYFLIFLAPLASTFDRRRVKKREVACLLAASYFMFFLYLMTH